MSSESILGMYGNIQMTEFKKKIKGLIIYSITIIFCIILCLVYLRSGTIMCK